MADDEDRIREFYTDCSEIELLEDEPVELAEPSIESAIDVLERLAEREPELVAGFLRALRGASFDTLSKISGCPPGAAAEPADAFAGLAAPAADANEQRPHWRWPGEGVGVELIQASPEEPRYDPDTGRRLNPGPRAFRDRARPIGSHWSG